MHSGPLVVSFVGSSGVGKTTVIEQLIPLVAAAGLRVGTVKHASHGHDVDKVGSDSWRHRRAGAEAVLLAGASGAVLFLTPVDPPSPQIPAHHTPGGNLPLDRIADLVAVHLADLDVVLAEGFAPIHDLLILIERAEVPPKAEAVPGEAWLTISDVPDGSDEYGFDQLGSVTARIVTRVTALRGHSAEL